MNPEGSGGKIRALIVDDEPLARSNLRVLLRRDSEVEVVNESQSGMEGLAEIRKRRPDLVFLDVQMPECDGFDVLELLGPDVPPAIIFVTAYDQYALRAFEAGALDYLLKPFNNTRFEQALGRAKQRIREYRHHPARPDRLAVKSAGQVWFVRLSEIDWIEAADYYACLHVGARSHLLRRSLMELERELQGSVFCRIHRSTIVNLERVRALATNADGDYDVLLEDRTSLPVSRRYRRRLQEQLAERSLKIK